MPVLPTLRRRFVLLGSLLVSAAGVVGPLAAAETANVPRKSPFMPANTAGQAVVSAGETIEFAGVSSMGTKTHLIFHDKTAKKSRWVGLGETVEGISAVSYDARREEAVVKVNGVQKTLALRKGTGTTAAPAPAPVAVLPPAGGFAVPMPLPAPDPAFTGTPSTPGPGQMISAAAPAQPPAHASTAGPATPAQIAKQESDARMLVSDLLEIGMAQRKAYEEAHRRAAQGEAAPAPAPAAGQPGAAPQNPGQP